MENTCRYHEQVLNKFPAAYLKELSVGLTHIFTVLPTGCKFTGVLSTLWPQAFVSSINKMEPWCMPENYRPVSLTCVSSMLFEHILWWHIRNHLDRPHPPLPAKAYTMLVLKFENHPLFADFWRKKPQQNTPFQPESLMLRPNKTQLFKQTHFFLLYQIKYPFCESENNCIKLKTCF